MNFASFAHADELMHIHNERNFPKARLDSEINVPFLLNGHGDLYFLSYNNRVHILFHLKKLKKKLIGRKKRCRLPFTILP